VGPQRPRRPAASAAIWDHRAGPPEPGQRGAGRRRPGRRPGPGVWPSIAWPVVPPRSVADFHGLHLVHSPSETAWLKADCLNGSRFRTRSIVVIYRSVVTGTHKPDIWLVASSADRLSRSGMVAFAICPPARKSRAGPSPSRDGDPAEHVFTGRCAPSSSRCYHRPIAPEHSSRSSRPLNHRAEEPTPTALRCASGIPRFARPVRQRPHRSWPSTAGHELIARLWRQWFDAAAARRPSMNRQRGGGRPQVERRGPRPAVSAPSPAGRAGSMSASARASASPGGTSRSRCPRRVRDADTAVATTGARQRLHQRDRDAPGLAAREDDARLDDDVGSPSSSATRSRGCRPEQDLVGQPAAAIASRVALLPSPTIRHGRGRPCAGPPRPGWRGPSAAGAWRPETSWPSRAAGDLFGPGRGGRRPHPRRQWITSTDWQPPYQPVSSRRLWSESSPRERRPAQLLVEHRPFHVDVGRAPKL
jgi:hypothetical protein